MSLRFLQSKGIPLPPFETFEDLAAKDIIEKIRSFYFRLEKSKDSDLHECGEGYFLELMANYPRSMCNQHMTESIKEVVALIYFESKPNPEGEKPVWNGFSYEQLAILFDRSKATIHEAIKQKEAKARQLLEEPKLRAKAREMALEELVMEEKEKLILEQENSKGSNKTTERTLINPVRE